MPPTSLPTLGAVSNPLILGQNIVLASQMVQQKPVMPTPSLGSGAMDYSMDCRIYVGSLHYTLGQAEITALFSCFGTIVKFDLSHDPLTGRSKGYAFIEYDNPGKNNSNCLELSFRNDLKLNFHIASAQAATAMDGFELANRKVIIFNIIMS